MRGIAVSAAALATMMVASSAEAVEVQVDGFAFGCATPDGEVRKPRFGDVDGAYFTDLPAERKPCLETIDRMIYSCTANTIFISQDLNNRFPDCLEVFERQAEWCVRHFEEQRHKCDAGGSSASAETTTEPEGPGVAPLDVTMWAAKRSNIRSGPGTDHARVGLLEIGDEVQVTGEIGDWLRVEAPGGGDAFVLAPLLTEEAPKQVEELLAEATARQTTAVEPNPRTQGLPDNAEPAPDRSGASSPGSMRFKAWIRPVCVSPDGTMIQIPIPDLSYALDRGVCVGIVDIPVTASCDTRTAQCDWPCNDTRCGAEWPVIIPYASYADEARVVAEAARENPEATRADGLAKAAEFRENFLADTLDDADPPPPQGGAATPAVAAADSAQADDLHGSITFSQEADGGYAWGIAWSFDNRSGALAESIDQCQAYGGSDCAEVGWFSEACGALAIGDGNGYGAGWGDTTAEAERDALSQCRAANSNCRIEVARCSQSQDAGGQGRRPREDTVAASAEGEDEATSAILEPKCVWAFQGQYRDCWIEFSNRAGCHAFVATADSISRLRTVLFFSVPHPEFPSSPVSWSGACVRGVANGEGTVSATRTTESGVENWGASGAFSEGVASGHWTEVWSLEGNDPQEHRSEGIYVDGHPHGDWIVTRSHPEHYSCERHRYPNGDWLGLEEC